MTVFENWILKTVAVIVREMRAENEPDWAETYGTKEDRERYRKTFNEQWDAMEQRAAIVLVQARALELRHEAARVLINKPDTSKMEPETALAVSLAVSGVINDMNKRSREYEEIGLKMAKEWPPKPNEPDGPKLVTQ